MKKSIFALLFSLVLLGASQEISAKGIIVYHNGLQVSEVEKLPAEAILDGQHVNLGVSYEQFGLFWLPVWNYGEPQYVLISDDEETYWDLDEELLSGIKEEYSLDIPDTPEIPLWQKIGLKPVIILLIAFIIWGQFGNKPKEEEEETLSKESPEEEA